MRVLGTSAKRHNIHRTGTVFRGQFSTEERRKQMNPSTKDQIKGDLHQVKGEVKAKVGRVTNDPNLVADGQSEKLAGKVQKKIGQVEKVFEK
jgi:uncharacterized protein YjbJ (UPF0337 family)